MRELVLGDIHGAKKALDQVIERSGFNKKKDKLYFLGDVADGWSEVPECVETLLECSNLVSIGGNHDYWVKEWMESGLNPRLSGIWLPQGGKATFNAYVQRHGDLIKKHKSYFDSMIPYLILDNKLFTHGGFNWTIPFEENTIGDFSWDRRLFNTAAGFHRLDITDQITTFNEVYIGHTTTQSISDVPIKMCEVWAMDQGAGWSGKLSIMDINTKEYWQSDLVKDLYPEETGR